MSCIGQSGSIGRTNKKPTFVVETGTCTSHTAQVPTPMKLHEERALLPLAVPERRKPGSEFRVVQAVPLRRKSGSMLDGLNASAHTVVHTENAVVRKFIILRSLLPTI